MIPNGFRGQLLLITPCRFKEYYSGEHDSIKALSVWDGALVVNGDSWSRASQKYKIVLSVELPYGQIFLGLAPSFQAKFIHSLCEDLDFVYVWRAQYPADKEFTSYSKQHCCLTIYFAPKGLYNL